VPQGLSQDPIAYREWKRLAPELQRLGILTSLDRTMFEAYCRTYSEWVRFSREAREALIKNPSGRVRISPYAELADRALKNLRYLATEFGMTPSSRSRIKIEPPESSDDFDRFMGKK